jgi:hypothetical protein
LAAFEYELWLIGKTQKIETGQFPGKNIKRQMDDIV